MIFTVYFLLSLLFLHFLVFNILRVFALVLMDILAEIKVYVHCTGGSKKYAITNPNDKKSY